MSQAVRFGGEHWLEATPTVVDGALDCSSEVLEAAEVESQGHFLARHVLPKHPRRRLLEQASFDHCLALLPPFVFGGRRGLDDGLLVGGADLFCVGYGLGDELNMGLDGRRDVGEGTLGPR